MLAIKKLKKSVKFFCTGFVCAVFFCLFLAVTGQACAAGQEALVNGSVVNIRSDAGADKKIISSVTKGSRLAVLDKKGDWYKVQLANGSIGWIAGWLVTVQNTPATQPKSSDQSASNNKQLLVKGNMVNVRNGPGTTHNVLTQVSRGEKLPLLDKLGDWYKVQLPGGKLGWIVAWYTEEEKTQQNDNSPSVPNSGQQSKVPDVLTKINIKEEDGITKVKITGGNELIYNIFKLREPDRLVIDIQEVQPGDILSNQDINSKAVYRVRIGWFSRDPDVVRLVFDLKDRAAYRLPIPGDQNTVELEIYIPDTKSSLEGEIIVLDPGHGGADPGAIGPGGLVMEKDANLDVTCKVAQLLSDLGAKVILTRQDDKEVDLYERSAMANSKGAALFVSIHMNANNSPALAGTTTYYLRTAETNGLQRQEKSRILADEVQSQLVKTLGLEDKGIRQADFAVLRTTSMPAILIEVAFLSNPAEEKLIAKEQFRKEAASAIVEGISNYFINNS